MPKLPPYIKIFLSMGKPFFFLIAALFSAEISSNGGYCIALVHTRVASKTDEKLL